MATAEVKKEQLVYVCLPTTYCDGEKILSWVFSKFPKDVTKIVVTIIAKTSIHQTGPSKKKARDRYLDQGSSIEQKTLDQYLAECKKQQYFKAEGHVHSNDDQAKGIVDLIESKAIKKFVMEFKPNSGTIASVIEKAKPSCKIWFISQGGELMLTRNPKSDCTEATSEERIRREELHQKKIEETQKRENDKNDLLKRENELLKLEIQLLEKQRNDSLEKQRQWEEKFLNLEIDYCKLKHEKRKEHSGKTGGKSRFVS